MVTGGREIDIGERMIAERKNINMGFTNITWIIHELPIHP